MSASMWATSRPRAIRTPARTAAPFPELAGREWTLTSGKSAKVPHARDAVSSVLPSSTTMISVASGSNAPSLALPIRRSNPTSSRSASLKAGITMVRLTRPEEPAGGPWFRPLIGPWAGMWSALGLSPRCLSRVHAPRRRSRSVPRRVRWLVVGADGDRALGRDRLGMARTPAAYRQGSGPRPRRAPRGHRSGPDDLAAVDVEDVTGDPAGVVGEEEQAHADEIGRLALALEGERVDTRLGPAVVAGVEVGRGGGLVHDGPAAPGRHRLVAGPGADQRPGEVDREEPLQVVPVDGEQQVELHPTEDGGVVDEQVDPAEGLPGEGGHGAGRGLVGHVDADGGGRATALGDRSSHLDGVVHVQVGHDHVGST